MYLSYAPWSIFVWTHTFMRSIFSSKQIGWKLLEHSIPDSDGADARTKSSLNPSMMLALDSRQLFKFTLPHRRKFVTLPWFWGNGKPNVSGFAWTWPKLQLPLWRWRHRPSQQHQEIFQPCAGSASKWTIQFSHNKEIASFTRVALVPVTLCHVSHNSAQCLYLALLQPRSKHWPQSWGIWHSWLCVLQTQKKNRFENKTLIEKQCFCLWLCAYQCQESGRQYCLL